MSYDATNPPIWHPSIDAVIDRFATTAARRLKNFLIRYEYVYSVHRTYDSFLNIDILNT